MNKWQKIAGIIIISALIIAHIWAFIDYLKFATAAEFWCAEITQAAFFDNIYNSRQHFLFYNILSVLDIILIIVLFVVLWRKGVKR